MNLRRSHRVVLVAIGLVLSACGSSGSDSGGREGTSERRLEVPDQVVDAVGADYFFTSTEEMAATSDVVVVGRVVSTQVGRPLDMAEDLDEAVPIYLREATIEVEEVLKGPAGLRSVVLEQEGYSEDVSFALSDYPWVQVGDRGIYFLYDSTAAPEGHYYLINSVGQIVLAEDEVLVFSESPLAASYLAADPAALLEDVASDVSMAVELDIPAQQPYSVAPEEVDLPDQPRDEGVAEETS